MALLQETANRLAAVLESIPGSSEVKAQVLGGLPFLKIAIDRERIARYKIDVSRAKVDFREL